MRTRIMIAAMTLPLQLGVTHATAQDRTTVTDIEAVADALEAQQPSARRAPPPAPAAPGVPGNPGDTATIRLDAVECLPSAVAQGSDVVVLSTNGGGAPVPFAIQGAQQQPRVVTVSGGKGAGVVLVLSASQSTLWDLRGIAPGRIKAILAHGSEPQAVIGAEDGVRTEFLDRTARQQGCRSIQPGVDVSRLMEAQRFSRARFGRAPSRLYSGQTAAFDIDGATPKVPASIDVDPAKVKAAAPIDDKSLLPGTAGLRQLVERGDARPFTMSDVQAWKAAGGTVSSEGPALPGGYEHLPPEVRERIERSRAESRRQMPDPRTGFVLVRSVERMPTGIRSNFGSALVIPEGVQAPMQEANGFIYRLTGVPLDRLAAMPKAMPAELARMDVSGGATGPVTLAATWRPDGILVRMTDPNDPDGQASGTTPMAVAAAEEPASSSLPGWLVAGLIAIALTVAGAAFLLVRKRRSGDAPAKSGTRPTARRAAGTAPDAEQDDEEVTRLLAALEATSEDPALTATLSAFHQQISKLVLREDLEDDLLERCGEIVDGRFAAAARRYLKSRASADEANRRALDEAMRDTVSSMTKELSDVHETQNRRNVEALRGRAGGTPDADR